MTIPEKAVQWAVEIAKNPEHGYDQASRWGPNYDCSSLIISAYDQAGVKVRQNGASYTGNMRSALLKSGFKVVTDNTLQAGDVLLNEKNHTAMYIGAGQLVQASVNERGGITGGVSGDQTGREINISPYYNYPWDVILRYNGADNAQTPPPAPDPVQETCLVVAPFLIRGDYGTSVRMLQALLLEHGCQLPNYGKDGDFGGETEAAVKVFQRAARLDDDGEVGPMTWAALLGR